MSGHSSKVWLTIALINLLERDVSSFDSDAFVVVKLSTPLRQNFPCLYVIFFLKMTGGMYEVIRKHFL